MASDPFHLVPSRINTFKGTILILKCARSYIPHFKEVILKIPILNRHENSQRNMVDFDTWEKAIEMGSSAQPSLASPPDACWKCKLPTCLLGGGHCKDWNDACWSPTSNRK